MTAFTRHDPFAAPILSLDLDDGAWRAALLADIEAWRAEHPDSLGRSDRGAAWHSPDNANIAAIRPAFGPLVREIVSAATEAFRAGGYFGRSRVRLTGVWANVSPPGAWNAPHHHGDALWSGVYYLRLPEDAPPLVFEDPRQGAVRRARLANGALEPDTFAPELAEGRLLLFPGWLRHRVEPNMGAGTRVSVSFNIDQVFPPEVAPLPDRKPGAPHWTLRRRTLTRAQAERLCAHAREAEGWKTAQVGEARVDPAVRDSNILWLDAESPLSEFHDVWVRLVRAAHAENDRHFGLDIGGRVQTLQLTRYAPGQHYGVHTDRGGNAPLRALSCSVLLAAADEGGGMRFPAAPDRPPPLAPGDALFFRGDEPHEALPATAGERLSLVAWLEQAQR